ncbi:MAG: hypothetical protein HY925_15945 [Elusimicrobia bacterium]|nr:hypothetical protein [Elusimicrobiota bacterium]
MAVTGKISPKSDKPPLKGALMLGVLVILRGPVAWGQPVPAPLSDAPAAQVLILPPAPKSEAVSGLSQIRVIEVFKEGGGVRVILQSDRALVAGRSLFAGPDEAPVTVGDLLSESGGFFYYGASAHERGSLSRGDIALEQKTRPSVGPSRLTFRFKDMFKFGPEKHTAAVTAVQGDRAMIDRGTLNEIHERDLYRVYDASGSYKGLLEIGGLGDTQSSGKLYNAFEDRWKRALETKPGDKAIFVGQRRLLGLGLVAGSRFARKQALYAFDKGLGAGLLWNITFFNGWGLEMLFGQYSIESKDSSLLARSPGPGFLDRTVIDDRAAKFIAPTWVKKNFFYPAVVSPFLGAGLSYFDGYHSFETFGVNGKSEGIEKKSVRSVAPMFGGGIEFFPVRFFRVRVDARHFISPRITSRENQFSTESTFYSFGILTAW